MMKKQSYRLIEPFLLMAFSLLLITACYQPVIQKTHISLKPSVDCRIIQHEFGETCVPLKPQRIITLSPDITLAPLIAFGIKPIGFTSYYIPGKGKESLYGVSFDQVKGAKNVGNVYQPSLEKILLLKPDLILYCCDAHLHQSLSAIAPTVAVPALYNTPDHKAYFKENLRYVAKLLGQETKAEEVLSQYQKRIEQLKKRLGSQLQQIEISVIFYNNDGFWTISNKNRDLVPAILNDIGLRYKFLPHGGSRYVKLSIENIGEYDADILFIVDVGERTSSFYFQNPMFSSLKAIKNNRAYVVSQEKWDSNGIAEANRVLDDLFKYLPEGG
ncbi:iron-siderophore ABC transporter substrate-binding protein [Nostoc favosum]|uniref:Iron-siderophore ABC transporter substrate-binding protein n=1 Tax=Nostoc favosum CHAB5714 TaxID=2780399 RepID=A0ABS8IHQ0_9NOSO|nr:iron-siderophore ABC transporter substrate-binding protein [Nostoc favosum]MCC5603298.1 iron-siderophore ABC transporter substrate-binding protein [Nostoc favosum CHAB5714]